jgi:hypothetical protein
VRASVRPPPIFLRLAPHGRTSCDAIPEHESAAAEPAELVMIGGRIGPRRPYGAPIAILEGCPLSEPAQGADALLGLPVSHRDQTRAGVVLTRSRLTLPPSMSRRFALPVHDLWAARLRATLGRAGADAVRGPRALPRPLGRGRLARSPNVRLLYPIAAFRAQGGLG